MQISGRACSFTRAGSLVAAAIWASYWPWRGREPEPPGQGAPVARDGVVRILESRVLYSDSLAQITAVATLPESGLVAALDQVTGLIALFEGRTGTIRGYLGGRKSGPGSLNCGSQLFLSGQSVLVLDSCRQRFIEFAIGGQHVKDVRAVRGEGVLNAYGRFARLGSILLHSRRVSALSGNQAAKPIRHGKDQLVAQADSAVRVIAEAPSAWIDVARSGPPFLVPAPYRPRLIWDVHPATQLIALSRQQDLVVEFFTVSGDQSGTLRLPVQGRPVSRQDRAEVIRKYREEVSSHRTDVNLERLTFPERMPAIEALRFDPSGRLWLRTTAPPRSPGKPDSLQIVVFRYGEPSFVRFWFRCFPVAFLSAEELLCREKDSLDVEYLRAFKFNLELQTP